MSDPSLREYKTVEAVGIMKPNRKLYAFFDSSGRCFISRSRFLISILMLSTSSTAAFPVQGYH